MNGLLVACLCAEWCDTCREYRAEFEALSKEYPSHRFVWIDIEDQDALVADVDIQDFPTLLIADNGNLLFAGTMLPHIGHLRRMLQALDENPLPRLGELSVAERSAFGVLATHLRKECK